MRNSLAGLVRAKNGADDLLLLMEKEAQKYINTPKLQELLQWADAATKDSEGEFKPVGKRAAAIAIANPVAIIANPVAYLFPNANAIDKANANAILNAIAIANVNGLSIVNAHIMAFPNFKTNAYLSLIARAEEFQTITIFKDVNWTELIAQLTALKDRFPDANQSDQTDLAFLDGLSDTWCHGLHLNPEILKLSKEEAEALRDYLFANLLIIQCKEAAVRISAKTWEEIESRMLLVPENSTI